MVTYRALSPELIRSLLPVAYDLAEPVACDWLSSGLNDVFKVTTGEDPCILKVYRAGWRTQTEVQEEIAALFHLDRKGIRVTLPIARRDGAFVWTLAPPDRARPVVLFAHAVGKAIVAPDESDWQRFGQTLAEVHTATDDFTDAPVRYDLENLFAFPLRELTSFLADRTDDRAFVCELVGRLRERIETSPADTLDWGYCHGDFRAANLHLDEATGAVTVFDFELGGTGFRAYDLAYTYMYLHRMALELLWRAPVQENHEKLWAAFLHGYAERRPLHTTDRETIPLFVAMRAVHLMAMLVQTARQNDNQETWPPSEAGGLPGGDLFDRTLEFLRRWNEVSL